MESAFCTRWIHPPLSISRRTRFQLNRYVSSSLQYNDDDNKTSSCTATETCLVIIVSQYAGSSTPSEEIRMIQTLQSREHHCQTEQNQSYHPFRFGLDSLAFNHLIVVLPQAPGFGALQKTHG
ncbi:hypothetical protein BO79DRAFT_255961 [Aspergillus costaricaensis CBS 115574]|uniref:Uncharacterized protein n=1 Tax=Aspergillus costaricaensis CBS 115574 TaxID=1448317 RepID=A0ACD1IDH5_9EURO|nr:hypothetical protein BO79DRAFT_255961 [Aspergillus costaricaensis CBS 115574]RAK87795.1 hypothetical protein BO79DRAFT_255961 [Aspergillus costaricaensis CBS 115574]